MRKWSTLRKWDQETDVVVVGSGFAGLAASIEADDAGAETIVLEKMRYLGGNSIISGGGINAVVPERQSKQGIEDSVDLFYVQTLAGGDYRGDPVKVRFMAENSRGTFEWLVKMGVPFIDDVVQTFGNAWPREHTMASGGAMGIKALLNQVRERGVPVLTEHQVVKIVRKNPLEGRILGVEVRTKKGILAFRARKGLVLASGGYAADFVLLKLYDPRIDERLSTTNHLGATGECIQLSEDVGARTVGMDYVQYMAVSGLDIRASTNQLKRQYAPIRKVFNVTSIDRVVICSLDGNRIVASDARRDVITNAVFATKEKVALVLSDDAAREDADKEEEKRTQRRTISREKAMEVAKENPTQVFYGVTIRDLAEKIGIDPKTLEDTVAKYNSYVDARHDPELGQKPENLRHKIQKPPFWAGTASPSVHYIMGGLNIDINCRVLDRWGKIIPGFYAAGEVTGGIHGTNRLGGNSITDCIVFGRVAGKNVAAVEPRLIL